MKLIVDSGSTNAQWVLVANNGDCSQFKTDGINPFYQSREGMKNTIMSQLMPQIAHLLWVGPIEQVFFYGAGCTPEKKPFVEEALQTSFKKAKIHVESDLVGACRALLGDKEGIACVLGTGSNSCHYDGKEILKNVSPLGYVLGDEGSGAVLGKRLVADILKNQISSDVKELFFVEMNTAQAEIMENVYRRPFPNRYLASLSKFCVNHLDIQRIYDLVYDNFDSFVKRNVLQYPKNLPVGFVGSIAYYYRAVLEKVLEANNLTLQTIAQSPIDGLIQYHIPTSNHKP